ncbi:MAG: hypothetical protein OXF97_00970 [Nitrospira sp.]|nr:hypothetical protein [Nitrospira sp.]
MEIEWQNLWLELEIMDDAEARRENTRLSRRISDVTGWAGQADIRENQKLLASPIKGVLSA